MNAEQQMEYDRLMKEAASREQAKEESFERCDTDGFLSQWAQGIAAQKLRTQAKLLEHDGRWHFFGLYDGDRRVKAKRVTVPGFNSHGLVTRWILHPSEVVKYGRKFIPCGPSSRIQKMLGLSERQEMANAYVDIVGHGRGLSGCASARVCILRDWKDEWGQESVLIRRVP